jgi:hypothetical protein
MTEFKARLSNYSKNLALARDTAKRRIYLENLPGIGSAMWAYYNEEIFHYENNFRSLLPPKGFVELIDQKGEVLMLDTFGPLSFIRKLAEKTSKIKGGMALSLADQREKELRKVDESRNLFQLENADLFDSRWWMKDVKSFLQDNKKTGFDLITCMPISGWRIKDAKGQSIFPPVELLWTVTNTLWRLLADDGSMFIRFPFKDPEPTWNWIEQAKNKYGLDIEKDKMLVSVRINKNGSKLQQFPFPEGQAA